MSMNPLYQMQNVMQRAQQLAQSFQNPQQMIMRFLPDLPAEISNNPDQIVMWLQQTGKCTPEQIQMARQMTGR